MQALHNLVKVHPTTEDSAYSESFFGPMESSQKSKHMSCPRLSD